MLLKILGHPVFANLNFHMPLIVDLSHPLIMLKGENGCGKSTLLHAIYYALRGDKIDGYIYKIEDGKSNASQVMLFDAEQHNPRAHPELFDTQPEMKEFIQMASHGQVMLSMFSQTFPSFPNQRRILKMLMELVDQKQFRIVAATHSPVLIDAKETYVIDLDRHINRNVIPSDLAVEGKSTIQ
jgi:predicted ATPase